MSDHTCQDCLRTWSGGACGRHGTGSIVFGPVYEQPLPTRMKLLTGPVDPPVEIDEGDLKPCCGWKERTASLESALREVVEALGSLRRNHYVSEDCWYSCPKSGECCDDGLDEYSCTCGADRTNATIEAALSKATALLEEK